MPLKKITAADFNTAIKKLTTSDASVWWKTLGETEDGTKLCFVMGWNDGYDEDEDGTMYQQDGYTLCTKIGYKPSNLMVMDYTDFNMPYDKKTAEVWDTNMSVGKGEVNDDAFDVKWYNDEAEAIWKKYGKPDREGKTALDLMESKNKEGKKHTCSMQKKKESLAKQNEYRRGELDFRGGFDFNGKPKKSVISKISKALDKVGISAVVDPSGKRLEVPFGDDAVYMTAMSQSYGSNKCSYVNVRQKSDRNTDVGVYNVGDAVKVVQEITQGLDAPNESKKHTCSMQKKKESLAKKVESALDIIRVSDEDVVLVPEQVIVEHTGGRSFSVEIPTKDNRYYLSEMKEILKGMCEDSSGYLTAYQDGSVIVIIVNVPAEDENGEWNGEYNEDYFARCRVELVGSSCDSIAEYLREE